jgi:hypothetical protein
MSYIYHIEFDIENESPFIGEELSDYVYNKLNTLPLPYSGPEYIQIIIKPKEKESPWPAKEE